MRGKEDSVDWIHLAGFRYLLRALVNTVFNFLNSRETVWLFVKLVM